MLALDVLGKKSDLIRWVSLVSEAVDRLPVVGLTNLADVLFCAAIGKRHEWREGTQFACHAEAGETEASPLCRLVWSRRSAAAGRSSAKLRRNPASNSSQPLQGLERISALLEELLIRHIEVGLRQL